MAAKDERERWAKALIKVLPDAESALDVRPFLSKLQSDNILSPYEHADVVKDSNNKIDQVRLVFHAAARKDTQYMKKFVEILDVPGTEQWARQIREQVEPAPMDHGQQPLPEGNEEVDNPGRQVPKPQIAIITANPTEENVVKRYLTLGDSGRVWEELKDYNWSRDPFLQKKKIKVALVDEEDIFEVFAIGGVTGVHVKCARIGPGGAKETTSKLLQKATKEKWPLQVIFAVGCCGVSMSDAKKKAKVNWRGTVLLSDQLEDYLDSGKAEESGLQTKSQTYRLSSVWQNRLLADAIVQPDVEEESNRDIPVEKVDKYLSGPLVIKSEEEGNKYRGGCPMVGIEMEGSSVCSTVEGMQSEVAVAVVKGISDYGGRDKNEEVKSVKFGKETEGEVDDKARQEIATFHAVTLVTRCVASNAKHL